MEYDIDIDEKPKSSNKKRKISNLLFPGNSSAFEKRQKKYFLFQASRRERETNFQISIREGCQKKPGKSFLENETWDRMRHGRQEAKETEDTGETKKAEETKKMPFLCSSFSLHI